MNLKCTSLTFSHVGKTLVRRRVSAGTVQVTGPHVTCRALFESSVDVLHLFVARHLLGECSEDMFNRPHLGDICIDDFKLVRNPALERLGHAPSVSQADAAARPACVRTNICWDAALNLRGSVCGAETQCAQHCIELRLSYAGSPYDGVQALVGEHRIAREQKLMLIGDQVIAFLKISGFSCVVPKAKR
jgi:hypothetical protein